MATIICDCKCCKAERPRYNRITSICIREVSGKKKRATQRVLIVYKLEAAFWGTHKTNRIGYMDVRFKSNCRCICATSFRPQFVLHELVPLGSISTGASERERSHRHTRGHGISKQTRNG